MKCRNGMVSNSSSSSFIVPCNTNGISLRKTSSRKYGTETESEIHRKVFKWIDDEVNSGWFFEIYRGYLIGSTFLDNISLKYIVKKFHMCQENMVIFGAHCGFEHELENLRHIVDTFID